MEALSLKDLVLMFIVPGIGYLCYAVYKMNAAMSSLNTWIQTWPKAHEDLDNSRHADILRELSVVQAKIK